MKVWDNAGVEREVEPADAKEIVENGGSYEQPVKAAKEVEAEADPKAKPEVKAEEKLKAEVKVKKKAEK